MLQECIKLFDQCRNTSLLVHRLIGQWAKLAAQRCNHPTRKVKVATLRAAKMLLDADHLLLSDEAVPATKRLSVVGRISVVGLHILTHDLCSVARDIESRWETVLDAHASGALSVDGVPSRPILLDGIAKVGDGGRIGH